MSTAGPHAPNHAKPPSDCKVSGRRATSKPSKSNQSETSQGINLSCLSPSQLAATTVDPTLINPSFFIDGAFPSQVVRFPTQTPKKITISLGLINTAPTFPHQPPLRALASRPRSLPASASLPPAGRWHWRAPAPAAAARRRRPPPPGPRSAAAPPGSSAAAPAASAAKPRSQKTNVARGKKSRRGRS